MEAEVRAVLGKYGLLAVREFVEAECKATWEYLNRLYGTTVNPAPVPSETEKVEPVHPVVEKTVLELMSTEHATDNGTITVNQEEEKVKEDKKVIQRRPIKVIDFLKKPIVVNLVSNAEQRRNVLVEKEDTKEDIVFETEHSSEELQEASSIEGDKQYKVKTKEERDEEKRIHKETVKRKHDELVSQGIKPSSLLTKENLARWLGEGKSYQRISREHVGLNETIISHTASRYGLSSQIAGLLRRKGVQ
jgi:hypothetical protein